jgi:Golgi apparatus protein 1
VEMVARDDAGRPQGITLTGWSALLGIAALVVAVFGGGLYAWRQYTGAGDAATVVLKSRQPYVRVSTSGS